MNKSLQLKVYHKLRRTNPKLAKTKIGRSMIMDQAVQTVRWELGATWGKRLAFYALVTGV